MAKVIQVSEATSLAFHAIVLIGRSDSILNVQRIAEVTGASRHHLAKVLQRLAKDKFIKSIKGPSGGFVLNKSADKITLFDIYESIEGKVVETGCPLDRNICPFTTCLTGGVVADLTKQFIDHFSSLTLTTYL